MCRRENCLNDEKDDSKMSVEEEDEASAEKWLNDDVVLMRSENLIDRQTRNAAGHAILFKMSA